MDPLKQESLITSLNNSILETRNEVSQKIEQFVERFREIRTSFDGEKLDLSGFGQVMVEYSNLIDEISISVIHKEEGVKRFLELSKKNIDQLQDFPKSMLNITQKVKVYHIFKTIKVILESSNQDSQKKENPKKLKEWAKKICESLNLNFKKEVNTFMDKDLLSEKIELEINENSSLSEEEKDKLNVFLNRNLEDKNKAYERSILNFLEHKFSEEQVLKTEEGSHPRDKNHLKNEYDGTSRTPMFLIDYKED